MSIDKSAMEEYLSMVFDQLGLTLTEKQRKLSLVYYDFLMEYNLKVNLTRITDPREVASKHFGDSLMLGKIFPFFSGCRVADVGTGAGFPGIPLAICYPECQVTLMDSLKKRTLFLSEAINLLRLPNVEIKWGRAEDIGRDTAYRSAYDVVVARAVAPLNVLVELCLPLVCLRGNF
jgi:16S rRNA (guanine527-N7)-methyltransferase